MVIKDRYKTTNAGEGDVGPAKPVLAGADTPAASFSSCRFSVEVCKETKGKKSSLCAEKKQNQTTESCMASESHKVF